MKTISLTNSSRLALIDDEDYSAVLVLDTKWSLHTKPTGQSIVSTKFFNGKHTILARFVLGLHKSSYPLVDHWSGDIFDNQKKNLRKVSFSQNGANTKLWSTNISGYKGVSWNTRMQKWKARIAAKGKEYFLGYFTDKVLAAIAYDDKAIELFGEFARLNFQLYGA